MANIPILGKFASATEEGILAEAREIAVGATRLTDVLGLEEYDPAAEYAVGDCAAHGGSLWRCTAATTGAWDAEDWEELDDLLTQLAEGGGGLSLGETSDTAYRGDRGKAAYDHSQLSSGNPHNVSKADVGLGNVANERQYSALNPPPKELPPVTASDNGKVLTVAGGAWSAAKPGPEEVTISSAGTVSQTLDAGKIYHFTGTLNRLTVSLNGTADTPHYHFDFLSGSGPAELVLPEGVNMASFTVREGKRYEVDILGSWGVAAEWDCS